jgi:hypothetical protein
VPDDEQIIEAGPRPKTGQTVPPVNARPMTGQAAMTALGIPDISTMTPDEQMMFAAGTIPMIAGGPEARAAEEAAPEIAQAVRQGIRAYHGSPYDFERFDLSKVGSGEGAQAYGHGLYFAQSPDVAAQYKHSTSDLRDWPIKGENPDWRVPSWVGKTINSSPRGLDDMIENFSNRVEQAKAENHWNVGGLQDIVDALSAVKAGKAELQKPGHQYEVAINADAEHFLDWDRPLSEQPHVLEKAPQLLEAAKQEAYQRALAATHQDRADQLWTMVKDPTQAPGEFAMRGMAGGNRPSEQQITAQLREAGIPGIRYLDQGSRTDVRKSLEELPRWQAQLETAQKTLADAHDQGASPRDIAAHAAEVQRVQNGIDRVSGHIEGATRNYVIFDDSLISILKKYGLAGLIAAGAAHFKLPADQQSEPEPEQHSRGGKVNYRYERVPLRRYAKGGAVKMSKQAANYRDSAEDNRFCARCSMYRDENKCTLVAGPVHRVGLCDYYEKAR